MRISGVGGWTTRRRIIAHVYSFLRIMEIPSTLSEEEMNRLEPLIEDTIETDRLMTGTSW